MQVQIEVQGIEPLTKKLQQLQSIGSDLTPIMAELANHLYNIADESFQKQQTPDGISWNPIKPRKDDQSPNKILYDEGTMQGSLSQKSNSNEATVGLNATANGYPYPIVHQFGSKDGSIEARAFMPIHEDGTIYEGTLKELEDIVEVFFEKAITS
jgi:phage virion morphogenesis protein